MLRSLWHNRETTIRLKGQLDLTRKAYGGVEAVCRTQIYLIQQSIQFCYPVTSLVVQDARVCIGHNGVKESLTEVQSRYWIMKSQSLTRAIMHKCTNCKNYEGAPFDGPPPLPEFRIKDDPAFTYIGVDFAGPLSIHGITHSDKVLMCVFTCLVTWAVHLDIRQSVH